MDIVWRFISLSKIEAAMGIAKKRRKNTTNSSVLQQQRAVKSSVV
jgi:hypothetical protein